MSAGTVLRQFGPMVYAPTLLYTLGMGAVIPLLPVMAAKLGANLALAALIAGALVVGQLCGNLPAGWLVSRIGERLTMIGAASVAVLALMAMALADVMTLFAASVLLLGFCSSAFGLARHAFMTTRVPLEIRARAMALLGGSYRLGIFLGPFIAAAMLQFFHEERATIWFFIGCLVATILLVALGPDPEKRHPIRATARAELITDSGEPGTGSIPIQGRIGILRTIRTHRGVLARLGLSAATLSALRHAQLIVLPLWGVSLGLDAQTIALVIGVAGALDFSLFYASGQVMDRFGRIWAAVPSMLLMGTAFLVLSVTHDGELAVLWFGMLSAVVGVGNGISSGVLMTLGSDTAPPYDPAPYLGSWRMIADTGGAAAPLMVSAVAAIASLPIATAVLGVVGLVGAVGFLRYIPRYVPRSRH